MLKSIMFWVNVSFIFLVSTLLLSDLTMLKIITSSDMITIFAAFGGTLSGALVAYQLQTRKEDKKIFNVKISALHKALFILLRQINATAVIQKDIDSIRNKDDIEKAFNLPPYKTNKYNDLKFSFEELSFVLETDSLNLLHDLYINQECFEQMIESINQRTMYLTNEIYPEIENKDIDITNIRLDILVKSININKLNILINLTNHMFEHIDKTILDLEKVENELFLFSKTEFPNTRFIRSQKS